MKKKFLFIVLLFALFFGLNGDSTLAGPAYTTDQACTVENASDAIGIDLTENKSFQLFVPTKDNIRAIQVALATRNNNFAKAKIKLYRVMDMAGNYDGTLIAEKLTSIQGEAFVKVDFDNLGISEGIYAISVEAVHQNEKVYWIATTGTCYPGGYAIIDNETRMDLDFFFVMTSSLPVTINPVSNTNPAASSTNQSSGSGASSAGINSTAPSANQSSGSGTSSAAQTSTTPNNSISSSDSIKNVPSGAQKISSLSAAENEGLVDKSNMNQESAYQDQLMADKELQEQIAFILKDLDENKFRRGAFGLSGRVGRILTWPVFYGICGLILLIIIIVIILSIKRKKPLDVKANAEV